MIPIILERKEINKMVLDTINNFEISSNQLDISLDIRSATIIRDFKKKNLTIITNIMVVIKYNFEGDRKEEMTYSNGYEKDFLLLKESIKLSRIMSH